MYMCHIYTSSASSKNSKRSGRVTVSLAVAMEFEVRLAADVSRSQQQPGFTANKLGLQ